MADKTKATTDKSKEKPVEFETVAVLVLAMMETNTILSMKHYDIMASVDGERTASSFDHQFRKIKARAKELQGQIKNGDIATPTKNAKTGSKSATPATGEKKKGTKRCE